ncbi:hypothetical protein Celaphus_00005167, partial [Cervus elaphus hippelaphus]
MASARLQHPQQENGHGDRASCPSPLLGSGPIPWLLPCWRGLSCPLYLKELVIEALPPELFQCRKLRALHLGNNVLQSLPSR